MRGWKKRRTAYQRARRGEWHPAWEWLRVPLIVVLFVVTLPVALPIALVQHRLIEGRRRRRAEQTPCVQCGAGLGKAALDRADAAWSEHLAKWHREHPQMRFRMVRQVWAICAQCGQEFGYDEKTDAFVRREAEGPGGGFPA